MRQIGEVANCSLLIKWTINITVKDVASYHRKAITSKIHSINNKTNTVFVFAHANTEQIT